jgi:membrane-associated PAP2 superfamily phosphatase
MNVMLQYATLLTPILTALMQVIKLSFPLKKNWVPAINLVIGIVLGAAGTVFTDLDLVHRLWAGAFAGLSSVGLFEIFNKREGITKQE